MHLSLGKSRASAEFCRKKRSTKQKILHVGDELSGADVIQEVLGAIRTAAPVGRLASVSTHHVVRPSSWPSSHSDLSCSLALLSSKTPE